MKAALSLTLVLTLVTSALPVAAQERIDTTASQTFITSGLLVAESRERPEHTTTLRDAIEKTAIQFAKESQQSPTGPQAPTKSWRQRHPVAFGALIGLAAGAAIGAAAASQKNDTMQPWATELIVAGVGAGIGAIH